MEESIGQQFFGKPLKELTLDDLREFFATEQEESASVEFKEGTVEFDKLYKEVCAFLNTNGGLLILGSPREQQHGKRKWCQGDLILNRTISAKTDLYRKLASHIQPMPIGVQIYEIGDENGKAFILDIPQSEYAPHQCNDHRYYIRLDEESRPAPHGFVEALFNRRQSPVLEAEIVVMRRNDNEEPGYNRVDIVLSNQSRITANDVTILVYIGPIISALDLHLFSGSEDVGYIESPFLFRLPSRSYGMLVKGLTVPRSIEVRHCNEPFVIQVSYWCKDGQLQFAECIIDPVKEVRISDMDSRKDGQFESKLSRYVNEFIENKSKSLIRSYSHEFKDLECSWFIDWETSHIRWWIENNGTHPYRFALVEFKLQDRAGYQIDQFSRTIADILSGEKREMQQPIDRKKLHRLHTVRIVSMEGKVASDMY